MISREINAEVFRDTEEMIRKSEILLDSIENTKKRQIFYPADGEIGLPSKNKKKEAEIIVSGKRTLEAASAYKGKKICIMNFASATNPGGGVERGANAQEESICRSSTLYFCLNTPETKKEFYMPHRQAKNPLYNDDIIYSPDVCVIKTDNARAERLSAADWYKVNVITCAAPNLRKQPSNEMNLDSGDSAARISNGQLKELHEKRIRRIFEVAATNGNDVLIAGAFGCGAFKNPPDIVARVFHEITYEFRYMFETVEYAIACGKKPSKNYLIFEREFKKNTEQL